MELGFIKKSGAWFTYEGEQLGQGRENAKQFLRETPELMIEINERIRSQLAARSCSRADQRSAPAEATRTLPPTATTTSSISHQTDCRQATGSVERLRPGCTRSRQGVRDQSVRVAGMSDRSESCRRTGASVVTGIVGGHDLDPRLARVSSAMVDPSEAMRWWGRPVDERCHVPVISTPLRKTARGPLPVSCDWTSRPPSLFSSHGP